MLAEAGQTPTNYWHINRLGAVKSVAWNSYPGYLTLSMAGPHRQTVILKQYFQLKSVCQFHIQVQNISSSVTLCFPFTLSEDMPKYGQMTSCYWRERQSITQSSGYFRFIKTAQSRTLKSLFGPEVSGCSNIRQQASGFYGTRPRNNPIWHSHREGTRACSTDVEATDLTVQASLWAGPPRPSITCCDWLITISNFPVWCALSLSSALEKTTAAMRELRTWNQSAMINLSNTEYVPLGKFINVLLGPVQLTFSLSKP